MQQVSAAAITKKPDHGERGLTTQEAQERLAKVGPNEQTPTWRTADLIQILLLFTNSLVIMLLIVSIVSAFVGEIVNASIIVLMVVVSIVINFVQTWHSQRTLRSALTIAGPYIVSAPASTALVTSPKARCWQ